MHARTGTIIAAAACFAAGAPAQELFSVNLAEIGNPANNLFAGSSSLPDLVEDLADQAGAFTSFNNVPFAASLTYGGVENAIAFSYDPTGGANGGEVIRIDRLLGSSAIPAFDEANGDLGEQLRDFFLTDNPDAVSDFLQALAEQSLVAVTDGNPLATTARSARYKFERFGIHADWTESEGGLYNRFSVDHEGRAAVAQGDTDVQPLENLPVHNAKSNFRTRLHFIAQTVESNELEGFSFDLAPSFEFVFSEHVGIVGGLPFSYHQVEDADVFSGGFHLDIPIRIIIPDAGDDVGLTWIVTPGGSLDYSGSIDYAAGGLLWSGGVSTTVIGHIRQLRLIGAAQLTFHEGQKLAIDDFEFDPGVSQQILKVGGKAVYSIGEKIDLYGGITYTDFLDDAAVDNYLSPTGGVSFVFRNGANITVGYEGDIADDFERHGGRVGITLPF